MARIFGRCEPTPPARNTSPDTCRGSGPTATGLIAIVSGGSSQCAACLLHQIALDKLVEITVEHTVHIANFHLGPVILDHLVGLQHITPDLAAERDVALFPTQLLQPCLLLLLLQVEQTRLEHLHRLRAVLVL